ncbi:MAG: DUF4430 domain-containing protein [Candidatus Methanoplasma sp.]|jgi:hypothetical protein|nr:DUF4430 domain-containing protein [Candidatus Methanoplasma sp.]
MKKALLVLVAVVAVAVVAIGLFVALGGDKDDPNRITFLIEDDKGVYFWIAGSGETADKAFLDAAEKSAVDVASSDTPSGLFVTGIAGLEQTFDYSYYWTLQIYDGEEWKASDVGISSLKSSEHDYLAFVYSQSLGPPDYSVVLPEMPSVEDAKVWSKDSRSGVLFTIQSDSGMYFHVNGLGGTVFDAFSSACEEYKIPFEESSGMSGKGIKSIFDKGTTQDKQGNYTYWIQYVPKDGEWASSPSMMGNLDSKDYGRMFVMYAAYGNVPSLSIDV